MDLKASVYVAAQAAGLNTDFIGWRLDSGLSAAGVYGIADLAQAVDYHPSVSEAARLSEAQVLAAWEAIVLNDINAGGVVWLGAVLVTGEPVADVMTATVSPAAGSYGWALWVDGEKVDSSDVSGALDATDSYALAIDCGVAGNYLLRVVGSGGDTAQLAWEVQ